MELPASFAGLKNPTHHCGHYTFVLANKYCLSSRKVTCQSENSLDLGWFVQWLLSSHSKTTGPLKEALQPPSLTQTIALGLEILWTWDTFTRLILSLALYPIVSDYLFPIDSMNLFFFFFKLSVSTRTCPQLPQLSLLPLGPTDFTLRANNVEPPIAHTVPLSWEDASNKNHFIVSHLGLLTAEYSRPGTKPHSHLQCLLQGKDKLL